MPWIKKPEPRKVYTLKIMLDESNPLIWRRVEVTDVMRLGGLHATLQIAMGWEDCHMHEFKIKGTRYSARSPFGQVHDDEEGLDEGKSFLGDVLGKKGQRFSYWYDFGDDWMHTIKVEAISEPESGKHYPVCLDGAQACPPEDCGGLYGYYNMLEILNDPENEEYEIYKEWLPEDFDPDAFSVEAVNEMLQRVDD